MTGAKKLLMAAAGGGGDPLYVEDVFSTYLYAGNGSYQTITNGIDLLNEGGLVWGKSRTTSDRDNYWWDTERGYTSGDTNFSGNTISSNTTTAEQGGEHVRNIYEDGYQSWGGYHINMSGQDYVSWTFRKAEKFFDIVTYSSDTTSGARTLSHNLGSTPAFIIVKGLNFGDAWYVYHIGTGVNKYLELNLTGTGHASTNFWGVTDSTFTVDSFLNNNGSTGRNYVAYLFASDAGGFGDDGSENIIKCGSYTGNGNYTTGNAVNVGFEPQWLLIKNASRAHSNSDWVIYDVMRGYTGTNQAQAGLFANLSNAETTSGGKAYNSFITSSGFHLMDSNEAINFNGDTYIYIAIRRPMKTPESGTEVFAPISLGTTTEPGFVSNFVTDFTIHRTVNEVGSRQVSSRMTGNKYMFSNATNAEGSISAIQWDFMNGSRVGNGTANSNEIQWMFKRATGFMDVVAYTGTNGTISRNHNLTVAPELMIFKRRDGTGAWTVLSELDGSSYSEMALNSTIDKSTRNYSANQYLTAQPTATVFAQAAGYDNVSGADYITYLFATLAGVSKVGSVAHSGTTNVDCGFSAGARFVLVKRTDSTGDWYVWDSLRGIVAGNDPYLLLNTTDAQVTNTDYIDPLSSGFTLTSSFTAGTYLFLAIA
jgi:hypothetical protein